jgi:plastocyanin
MKSKHWTTLATVGFALLLPFIATWNKSLAGDDGQPEKLGTQKLQGGAPCARETATRADEVDLTANGFSPSCILVAKDDEVLFSNTDSGLHNISSDGVAPTQSTWVESGTLTPEAGFPYTFRERGSFGVHCRFHPDEHATVIVE